MKRFVWRLQRVLQIKQKQEQTKKAELLEMTEKLAKARGALIMQTKMLKDIISEICAEKPIQRLGQQELFLEFSKVNDEQIKKLKSTISELESQQKKKVSEFLAVKRFKEALEKLQMQAKRQFIKEQERLEQKELDEAAGVSFLGKVIKASEVKKSE